MAVLVDLGAVPECLCDDHLESLFKAMAEDPSGDLKTIWDRHENPFLAAHVEACTMRFQEILGQIQSLFSRFLTGKPMEELAKSDAPWMRWDEPAFLAARVHLESKSPESYTLDDWLLLAEWIIQKLLPEGVINTEAEYLTVRAALLGKIDAQMQADGTAPTREERWLDQLAEMVPSSFGQLPPKLLNPVEMATLRVSKARAAIGITAVRDATRTRMQSIIVDHVQAQMLGQKQGTNSHLQTAIGDAFGHLNRDFRRIAVTETGECCNQGFIAAQPIGQTVMRREAYRGACKFCSSINGKTFKVVDPADPNKDGQTSIWLNKTNLGRSASPRRRVGASLIEREPEEMWWPAAGVQHPHCRGSWSRVTDSLPPGVNPEFDKWLREKLKIVEPRTSEV